MKYQNNFTLLNLLILPFLISGDNVNPKFPQLQQSESVMIPDSLTNSSVDELLENEFYRNRYNPIFIFMCIVYTISTLSAIVTNFIVLLVYLLGYSSKTDLSKFLINLAVADFLQSTFCMPFSFITALIKRWVFGELMCPIVLFMQILAVSLSIYTMVAIGLDRYYAVRNPLKNYGHKTTKLTLTIVWAISISLASVQLFVARVQVLDDEEVDNTNNNNLTLPTVSPFQLKERLISSTPKSKYQKTYTCNEVWESREKQQMYTLFNFITVYLIPVFVLAYTYTSLGCIIKRATQPGNANTNRDLNFTKSKKKVIKMLIVLVLLFLICWFPLHAFNLIKDFTNWVDNWPSALWIFYSSHWLAMANCTINPFIYGYSNKNFRSEVYSLIFCCKCLNHREWKRHLKSERISKPGTVIFNKIPRSNADKTGGYAYGDNDVNTHFLSEKNRKSTQK